MIEHCTDVISVHCGWQGLRQSSVIRFAYPEGQLQQLSYRSFRSAGQSGCDGEPASMYRSFNRCSLSAVVLCKHTHRVWPIHRHHALHAADICGGSQLHCHSAELVCGSFRQYCEQSAAQSVAVGTCMLLRQVCMLLSHVSQEAHLVFKQLLRSPNCFRHAHTTENTLPEAHSAYALAVALQSRMACCFRWNMSAARRRHSVGNMRL